MLASDTVPFTSVISVDSTKIPYADLTYFTDPDLGIQPRYNSPLAAIAFARGRDTELLKGWRVYFQRLVSVVFVLRSFHIQLCLFRSSLATALDHRLYEEVRAIRYLALVRFRVPA